MRIGTLAGILSICFSSLASAAEVKGRVVGADGQPVAGAIIREAGSGLKTESDEAGRFSLTVAEDGSVRLVVLHPDYFEEEVRLDIRRGGGEVKVVLLPLIRQREEVVVTATRFPEPSAQVPVAGAVVNGDTIKEKMTANIADALNGLPGLVNLGSGGFTLVPSVRGMSRHRVLLMIDGARLASDRRTGPSASFVSPEDLDRVEVVRSAGAVYYGSDAMGGMINMFTSVPDIEPGVRGRLHGRYGTVNEEKGLGLSLQAGAGKMGFLVSAQGVDAGNYSSPQAEVLQSQFTQASLLGKVVYRSEERDLELSFLGARGTDIGKPNRSSASKPTWYPREDQNLVRLYWNERSLGRNTDLTVHVYVNPNSLETRAETKDPAGYVSKVSLSRTRSTDMGWQVSFRKMLAPSLRLTLGSDYSGRSGVQADIRDTSYDLGGAVTKIFEETPYAAGRRSDFGFFLAGDLTAVPDLDLTGGVRFDVLRQRANPGGSSTVEEKNSGALTGFLAGSWKVADAIRLFANIGRAYRAPELSERFYTGITGRGFIISNPGLKPESSLNLDAGIKVLSKRVFAGMYGFYYRIRDLIDRVPVPGIPLTYAYLNVDEGTVKGLEAEWEVFPVNALSFFGNASVLKGRSRTGAPLNDIPSARVAAGARLWVGRFVLEAVGTFIAGTNDPGPAEIAIPGAEWLNLRVKYAAGEHVRIQAAINNVLDRNYTARPDPESMPEPGRNVLLGFSYVF